MEHLSKMNPWTAFWLFMIVYSILDVTVFLQGYDSALFSHKTPVEIEGQRKKLGLDDE